MESSNPIVRNAMAAMLNSECRMRNAQSSGQQGETRWVTIGHTPVLVDKSGNPVRDNPAAKAARKRDFPYENDESKWPMLPSDAQMRQTPYRMFRKETEERLGNAVNKAWCEGKDVPDAAVVWYKERAPGGALKTVKIDIDIGREDIENISGHGLMHIATDHDEALIRQIPKLLAKGKYYKDNSQPGAFMVVMGQTVLSLKQKANGKYRIASCYDDKRKSADYARRGGQVLNADVAEGVWTSGF